VYKYDKVCKRLATGRWFSSGTPVSSTNKTDSHDITEILLKVAFYTIAQPLITSFVIHDAYHTYAFQIFEEWCTPTTRPLKSVPEFDRFSGKAIIYYPSPVITIIPSIN
jgi:hypothetical protein